MGSYDTVREMESLKLENKNPEYIIIQYCSNDFNGNLFYVKNGLNKYLEDARLSLRKNSKEYLDTKNNGIYPIIFGLLSTLRFSPNNKIFFSTDSRNIKKEAEVFSEILNDYSYLLKGKKIIIFESSGYGANHPEFGLEFTKSLNNKNNNIDFIVLDSVNFLKRKDYFYLDDHLTANGHKKIAKIISNQINFSDKND